MRLEQHFDALVPAQIPNEHDRPVGSGDGLFEDKVVGNEVGDDRIGTPSGQLRVGRDIELTRMNEFTRLERVRRPKAFTRATPGPTTGPYHDDAQRTHAIGAGPAQTSSPRINLLVAQT